MPDPRVPLKNPWVAAVLAYLIPGAGHLYQGRTFKGLLFMVCILGTFFYGLKLGNWQVVYYRRDFAHTHYGYYSQVLVGLPALPAFLQSKRYLNRDNEVQNSLDAPLSQPFTGELYQVTDEGDPLQGELTGQIQLKSVPGNFGPEVRGTFQGTLGEKPIALQLGGRFEMDRKIASQRGRGLLCDVLDSKSNPPEINGRITGTIPRRFVDWFEVPLDNHTLQALNGDLGKFFELALVYTWIAGLLNILAIWDAFEGPAYGYGDEEEDETENRRKEELEEPASEKTSSDATQAESKPETAIAGD